MFPLRVWQLLTRIHRSSEWTVGCWERGCTPSDNIHVSSDAILLSRFYEDFRFSSSRVGLLLILNLVCIWTECAELTRRWLTCTRTNHVLCPFLCLVRLVVDGRAQKNAARRRLDQQVVQLIFSIATKISTPCKLLRLRHRGTWQRLCIRVFGSQSDGERRIKNLLSIRMYARDFRRAELSNMKTRTAYWMISSRV